MNAPRRGLKIRRASRATSQCLFENSRAGLLKKVTRSLKIAYFAVAVAATAGPCVLVDAPSRVLQCLNTPRPFSFCWAIFYVYPTSHLSLLDLLICPFQRGRIRGLFLLVGLSFRFTKTQGEFLFLSICRNSRCSASTLQFGHPQFHEGLK